MESDDGLRTVECLRGRLLAERQASRTAKQDAQLMENKLMELEKELKDETKLSNKTEKRLKLLRKKLESLDLLPSFEVSEHCAVSCVSSTGSSCTKSPEISKIMEEKSSVESSSGPEDTKVDDHTSSSSLKASIING